MQFNPLENLEKIATKLNIKDRKRRLDTAKQLDELAKILIEWKKAKYEQDSSNLH